MPTLTSTIKESVTINGKVVGNEITTSVTNVDKYYQYTMTLPNPPVLAGIVTFGLQEEFGQLENAKLRYLRITNLDNTDSLFLQMGYPLNTAAFEVPAGQSFLLGKDLMRLNSISLVQMDGIRGVGGTGPIDIEVFIGVEN